MLGSALYYPHIDIDDADWLRSAVLFWDEVQTIVPRAIRKPYKNEDTKILWQEGFLEPLRCDLHPDLLDTLGKRVMTLMDRDSLEDFDLHARDPNRQSLLSARHAGDAIRRQFQRAYIHPDKLSPEIRSLAMRAGLARVHPEKMSREMRDLLEEIEFVSLHNRKIPPNLQRLLGRTTRLRDADGEWLLVDSQFAETYMSALAALLAKETDLSALTNEEPSMGVSLHTLIEDVKPLAPNEKKGALVSFVMENIRIDPITRIEKLLAFKRSRTDQLAELSAQFDDISSKISSAENSRELKAKVREAYSTRVRPKLEALKEELSDNSIQAIWEGIQRAVTISVPAGGTLAHFTGLSGTTLLTAGAAIAIADVSIKNYLARRRTRRVSPFTYLLDVERKFTSLTMAQARAR